MKTILILGGSGMLGSAVGQHFQTLPDYDVFLTGRDLSLAYGKKQNWIGFDPTGSNLGVCSDIRDVLERMPQNPDYILNCIGIIKPHMPKSISNAIFINSLFPHQLSKLCSSLGIKLIHITTDCVFTGDMGKYVEGNLHDALDEYGKSKSLGEPKDCMVLRTSIIGPEIHNQASLVAWAQSQAGKKVNGYVNHKWNGVSTKQYAKTCQQIIEKDLYLPELYHVFSNVVSKFELLQLINKRYDLGLEIEPVVARVTIDRTLDTEKDLMSKLEIPTIESQIMEM